jgi:hypothetical protein
MESERERGILSKRDRAYLLGYSDIESGSARERNVRRDIRERTRNAILDFSLLLEELEDKDREQIFSSNNAERFDNGLANAISFFYLGSLGRVPNFETVLSRGVWRAEQIRTDSEALAFDVNVSIDPEPVSQMDFDEIADRIRRGNWEELTEKEMRQFIKYYKKSGDFELGRPSEYVSERLEEFMEREKEALETRARTARESQQSKRDARKDKQTDNEQ